ncbi:hypothetical protein NLC82_05990, partial [Candidatus Aminicenantes bacterium AC-335-A11]|nr:hypothetical protein [Candidatus Aminicenantes bacterium AC-335-A11]
TLTSAVREISASLNYAKYKSIFQRAKFRVSFAERGYRIERFNTASKKWERDKWAICKNVIIYANNSPIFHPNGTVSNLTSIYISNSSGKYKITIAISGRIKAVKLDKD